MMLKESEMEQMMTMKNEEVEEFKFVICKVKKMKLRDGGYELLSDIVTMSKVNKLNGFHYDRYSALQIIRLDEKFYAVLERGCQFNVNNNIDGHYVKILPISISKFAGELIIGDTWHD